MNPYSQDASIIDFSIPSEMDTGANVASLGDRSRQLPPSSSSGSSIHELGKSFLKLLSILRGGNHPYLDQYKAHLDSMNAVGWSQG